MKTLLGYGLMSTESIFVSALIVGVLAIALGYCNDKLDSSNGKRAPTLRLYNGARWLCAYANNHGNASEMTRQREAGEALEWKLVRLCNVRALIGLLICANVVVLLHQLMVYIWFYTR